jgi:hypothetical protein
MFGKRVSMSQDMKYFLQIVGVNLLILAVGLLLQGHETVRTILFWSWAGLMFIFLSLRVGFLYVLGFLGILFSVGWLFDRHANHDILLWGFLALMGFSCLAELSLHIYRRINRK